MRGAFGEVFVSVYIVSVFLCVGFFTFDEFGGDYAVTPEYVASGFAGFGLVGDVFGDYVTCALQGVVGGFDVVGEEFLGGEVDILAVSGEEDLGEWLESEFTCFGGTGLTFGLVGLVQVLESSSVPGIRD